LIIVIYKFDIIIIFNQPLESSGFAV